LIANRGEIAVRIACACRELGLRSIAVFSQADAGGLHVRRADAAVEIGPTPARQSYLNIERVLAAAQQAGADAVHPGYGFLAENAEFAEAAIAAGLVWIGPPPAAMRAMGDKAGARDLMEKAGVPILPGYQGKDDAASLRKAADQIGYPLLVKAAAGGGGVGQRVVNAAGELDEAIAAARREAKNAFNDERLILEKYLATARHVEVQVLGDEHGNLLHLFERECSLQRRRQKIIEETPSPLLDEKLRGEMTTAAVAAAKAAGYSNAGTVEFLVDSTTRGFYFLEMNTRLQVEHPITELTTGLDIVQWQLRIAAGEKLDTEQRDLKQRGHAIECRLYAEEAESNFLPQAGRVLRLRLPAGEGVRVDAGVGEGDAVGVYYDPLLAKLSVHAATRAEALERMQAALRQTAFLGVVNNVNFLQDLLADAEVAVGNYDTGFVERNLAKFVGKGSLPTEALIAAAFIEMQPATAANEADSEGADLFSPWAAANGFRLGTGK
jgi:acetyl/propionyl-CoA carboxylase alpha subunit